MDEHDLTMSHEAFARKMAMLRRPRSPLEQAEQDERVAVHLTVSSFLRQWFEMNAGGNPAPPFSNEEYAFAFPFSSGRVRFLVGRKAANLLGMTAKADDRWEWNEPSGRFWALSAYNDGPDIEVRARFSTDSEPWATLGALNVSNLHRLMTSGMRFGGKMTNSLPTRLAAAVWGPNRLTKPAWRPKRIVCGAGKLEALQRYVESRRPTSGPPAKWKLAWEVARDDDDDRASVIYIRSKSSMWWGEGVDEMWDPSFTAEIR